MIKQLILGVGIAALAFGAGTVYQKEYNTPKPCIQNFKDVWFGHNIQSMLSDDKTTWESGLTNRDIAIRVIYHGDKPEDRASIFKVDVSDRFIEYYVPSYCYVEDRGIFGPTLWKKP
jgi:hypothetical protein